MIEDRVIKRMTDVSSPFVVPSLAQKVLPSRRKGKDTFETILATAGELLAEVGFERLTTNLVCERAGMTPPALYRYFPNKYALVSELAKRLMEAQDEVLFAWLDEGGADSATIDGAVQKTVLLRKALIDVTRRHPGGMWILRAIRAVPVLQEVRIDSRDKVLDRYFVYLRSRYPDVPDEHIVAAARLSEQVGYAAIEMIMEDPDLDENRIVEEASWMTCLYFSQLGLRVAAEKLAKAKIASATRARQSSIRRAKATISATRIAPSRTRQSGNEV